MRNKSSIHPDHNLKELSQEIFQITAIIQENYPAFYKTLAETPLNPESSGLILNQTDLSEYLSFLKTQLAVFENQK